MPTALDLSLCMIVKDEAGRLRKCLNSVRGLASELIVVDTGSQDETPQVAASYGAKVLPFDFARIDFAAARNYGLAQARGRWILVLDADEVLDRSGVKQLKSILAGSEYAGYFLERRNHALDSSAATTDYVVRLFPNAAEVAYRGRVHETVDDSILAAGGKLLKSGIRIEHQFVRNRETRRRKNRWYIEILQEEIAADPTDTSRLDFLAAEYHQLEMYDAATEVAERLVKLRPDDARTHLFAGTYHLLFKPDFAQARADLQRALELKPNYPEAESFLRLLNEQERRAARTVDVA